MKNKTWIGIVALMLLFSLVSCGTNKDPTALAPVPQTETVTEETTTGPLSSEAEDAQPSDTVAEFNTTVEENQLEVDEIEQQGEEELEPNTEEEKQAQEEAEKSALLTKTNSISMLNYLTVIAEEVHQSSNSKLFLEEASHSLLNNLYPNAIDKKTQTHISNMVRNIDALRMIAVKRDRLAFIYEQNKAKALKNAMPSPLSIMNVVQSMNPLQALASVTYLAVDSYSSYFSANAAVELDYLKDGWELDDAGDNTISENRIEAFNYMQDIIRENGLDGDLALNSDAIIQFVKWQNNTNVTRRIQFLEQNEAVYSAFGGYWLLLSKSYYENGNYIGCVSAVDTYLDTQPRIFRKDIELAAVLPYVISSLSEVYNGSTLTEKELYYTDCLYTNTGNEDWALNYFAAVTYLDLYSKTKDNAYLQKAYTITKNNVNELIENQQKLNSEYLNPIKEQDAPKDATEAQKKDIKNYNKMLKEVRKKELPPVDNALLINVQLLFVLADELNISSAEKSIIDSMLHEKGSDLFLVNPIDNQYCFGSQEDVILTGRLDGKTLSIPATYVCDSSKIEVTVSQNGMSKTYSDWIIKEVERPKNKGVEEYVAVYESVEKLTIGSSATATVVIYPYGDDVGSVRLQFIAKEKKIAFVTNYEWELVK